VAPSTYQCNTYVTSQTPCSLPQVLYYMYRRGDTSDIIIEYRPKADQLVRRLERNEVEVVGNKVGGALPVIQFTVGQFSR